MFTLFSAAILEDQGTVLQHGGYLLGSIVLSNTDCKGPHTIKRCQRRIYKRSDQPKIYIKTIDCKADTFRDTNMTRTDKDSTLAEDFIVYGPLQFVLLVYKFSDRRSSQIRYAAFLKHGIWPCVV